MAEARYYSKVHLALALSLLFLVLAADFSSGGEADLWTTHKQKRAPEFAVIKTYAVGAATCRYYCQKHKAAGCVGINTDNNMVCELLYSVSTLDDNVGFDVYAL